MRTSLLVTVSLPPAMVKACEKIGRRHHMNRSEIMRAALRCFCEEHAALEAIRVYETEHRNGTLQKLTSLAALAA